MKEKIKHVAVEVLVPVVQVVLFSVAWALMIGAFVLPEADFVQSVPFGVVLVCLSLLFLTWFLFSILLKYKILFPSSVSEDQVIGFSKIALAFVFFVPIGMSWAENETLYGALNPIGYWQSENKATSEADCSIYQQWAEGALENFRVAENKFNMGIATTSELREAGESLKFSSSLFVKCLNDTRLRKELIRSRLNILDGVRS